MLLGAHQHKQDELCDFQRFSQNDSFSSAPFFFLPRLIASCFHFHVKQKCTELQLSLYIRDRAGELSRSLFKLWVNCYNKFHAGNISFRLLRAENSDLCNLWLHLLQSFWFQQQKQSSNTVSNTHISVLNLPKNLISMNSFYKLKNHNSSLKIYISVFFRNSFCKYYD